MRNCPEATLSNHDIVDLLPLDKEQLMSLLSLESEPRSPDLFEGGDFGSRAAPGSSVKDSRDRASSIASSNSAYSELVDGRMAKSWTMGSTRQWRRSLSNASNASALSAASSCYQQIVFDSKLSGAASPNSSTSGRRGPIGATARAAARAVKEITACWRCKFLRKTVSTSRGLQVFSDHNSAGFKTFVWRVQSLLLKDQRTVGQLLDAAAV